MYSIRVEQMMHTTHKDQMAYFCLRKKLKMTTLLEVRHPLIVDCSTNGVDEDRIATIKGQKC